jgi:serine/threonine-protein kinase
MRANLSFGTVTPTLLLFAAMLLAAGAARADDWLTYQNDRYGTTIDYPDLFKMQPPPDADDGRKFEAADGADFTVSASYFAATYFAPDLTVAKYHDYIVKTLDHGAAITYETRGKNWFVISGTLGDKIFYEKHLLSHGAQMNEDFVMSYPASVKQTYDPIVARMAKSFRPGKGFQSP